MVEQLLKQGVLCRRLPPCRVSTFGLRPRETPHPPGSGPVASRPGRYVSKCERERQSPPSARLTYSSNLPAGNIPGVGPETTREHLPSPSSMYVPRAAGSWRSSWLGAAVSRPGGTHLCPPLSCGSDDDVVVDHPLPSTPPASACRSARPPARPPDLPPPKNTHRLPAGAGRRPGPARTRRPAGLSQVTATQTRNRTDGGFPSAWSHQLPRHTLVRVRVLRPDPQRLPKQENAEARFVPKQLVYVTCCAW